MTTYTLIEDRRRRSQVKKPRCVVNIEAIYVQQQQQLLVTGWPASEPLGVRRDGLIHIE